MIALKLLLILTTLFSAAQPANILGFFSVPSISHQVVYQALWKELSLRGHQVTVVTPDPIRDPTLTNLTEIDVSYSYELFRNITSHFFSGAPNHWDMLKLFLFMTIPLNDVQFNHPEVKQLLHDNTRKFDVVLVEPFIPFPAAFSYKFNCPWISVISMDPMPHLHREMGNPHHPAIHPNIMTTHNVERTFFERLDSLLFDIYFSYLYKYEQIPLYDKHARQYFGDGMPYFGDILKNASMMFVNTDFIVQKPRALQPNVIEMGGKTHIKPKKPLPQDLKAYLDSAREGVVYFSFGSNVQGSLVDKKKRDIFIQAFSELPYKVLWKYEKEMEEKPYNVKLGKWLPQQDILGHPNVKLFITQAGFQSTEEAIVNKVPMLAIPFIADQYYNSKRIAQLGIGKDLSIRTLTKQQLKEAIVEIIENPKYKEKITKISNIAQDEPMTGLEKAVWWTEYVIRNKGAEYLKSKAYDFPWIQYLMLDIIGFLLIVMAMISYILYRVINYAICSLKILHKGVKLKMS